MNKKDFNSIRNEFNHQIKSFDSSERSNQNIFSICFEIENDLNKTLNRISLKHQPIVFSSSNFSAFSIVKEHSFSFYNEYDYKSQKDELLKSISNTCFINDKKNNKTFIFGGFNFDLSESNTDIWNDIPIANFILPRYTFINSKLVVNIFLDDGITIEKIKSLFLKYIDDLELILFARKNKDIKSELLDVSNLTSHDSHHKKITNLLDIFKTGNSDLIKVVFSRIKKVSFSDNLPLLDIYKNLLNKNDNSMNFLYPVSSNINIIGSTPELILSKLNYNIESESIAGSNYSKNNDFTSDEKEVIEQKIVTDYIIGFLNENSDNIAYNKKPKIKKSSDIEHLYTSFSADLVNDKNILDLLGEIHPTPAIGGYPKDKAFDMIRKYKENRGWYGGPIGWIDNNLDGRFYLNIRSGLGINKNLYLFSGSGITEKSNADNEWDETEEKFKLMLESL